MRKIFITRRLALIGAGAVWLAASGASAQQRRPPQPAATGNQKPPEQKQTAAPAVAAGKDAPAQSAAQQPKGKEQPVWRLRVTKDVPALFSLKAKDAPLTEIAAELSRKLEVPVLLSRVMQKQRVSHDFAGLTLEGAVRQLAPQPYIDYEVSGDPASFPKAVGIYLHALNENPPEASAVVRGDSEAMLIEGNTEEGTEEYEKQRDKEDEPLRVKIERNQISVRARKQPLTAVLYEIASKVDIPFEMKYESSDLVDVDFNGYTIDQAVRSLSPNIRLYMRTNLSSYEITPLRLVLVPPASSQQSTRM